MVDVDVGNIYVNSGGSISGNTISGGTTVKIQTTSTEYSLNNNISVIPIPVAPKKRDGSDNKLYARVIDLKRITETLTVSGYLEDENTERAITKRNNLLNFAKTKGELIVVWGQSNYQTIFKTDVDNNLFGMFIQKASFKESGGLVSEGDFTGDPAPERNIGVTIAFVRGKDI